MMIQIHITIPKTAADTQSWLNVLSILKNSEFIDDDVESITPVCELVEWDEEDEGEIWEVMVVYSLGLDVLSTVCSGVGIGVNEGVGIGVGARVGLAVCMGVGIGVCDGVGDGVGHGTLHLETAWVQLELIATWGK